MALRGVAALATARYGMAAVEWHGSAGPVSARLGKRIGGGLMPRPARPWFRFYVEAFSDLKLRRLTPAQRWLWAAILGAARKSPVPGMLLVSEDSPMDEVDLADFAGMAVRDVRKAMPLFERAGLVTKDESGAWCVPRFTARQYESDNSTKRTAKHRSKPPGGNAETGTLERSNNGERTAVGTPPETETETEITTRPPTTHAMAVDNPGEGDELIEQAVSLAAQRYGRSQVDKGKADNAEGLARWWIQENAPGARQRAASLLKSHELTLTQLADALVAGNPQWLNSYRRRTPA